MAKKAQRNNTASKYAGKSPGTVGRNAATGRFVDKKPVSKRKARVQQQDYIQFVYPAIIQEDAAGFYLVTFPDFPEAVTDGKTIDEALSEAVDCLDEAIAGRINREDDIPTPSKCRAAHSDIVTSTHIAFKAAIYMAMNEAGKKNTDIAKILGCDEKEVRRLIDPHHSSKLPRMEAMLRTLGKRVVVGFNQQPPAKRVV